MVVGAALEKASGGSRFDEEVVDDTVRSGDVARCGRVAEIVEEFGRRSHWILLSRHRTRKYSRDIANGVKWRHVKERTPGVLGGVSGYTLWKEVGWEWGVVRVAEG